MRGFVLALLTVYLGPAHGQTIDMGVRIDAPPFIWRDQDSGEYVGFFWDICTGAVQRATYTLDDTVAVDAEKRSQFLDEGIGEFDLLCDPTTITLERMRNFARDGRAPDLQFSPIVFVANGSYVQQPATRTAPNGRRVLAFEEAQSPPACEELVARLDDPNPLPENDNGGGDDTWIAWRFPEGEDEAVGFTGYEVWGYVAGATIGATVEETAAASRVAGEGTLVCTAPQPSHQKAAEAFCTGQLARYFGDVEIVRAAIEEYDKRLGYTCDADFSPTREGSYEPYAFVVSASRYPEFPELFTLALYSMFADGSVERLFAGHFGTRMSPSLGTLFRINGIPPGGEVAQPSGR